MNKQSGFTLVEIAIVLVIIGLLLGGVLKGQELINSAKVKSIVNDFRTVSSFVYSYQDRFRVFPGDQDQLRLTASFGVDAGGNPNATACTPQADGLCRNGNARIDGDWNPADAAAVLTMETGVFWQHVRLANLATGPTALADPNYIPRNADGGQIGIESGLNNAGAPAPFIANMRGAFYVCSDSILGRYVRQIDTSMDDGNTAGGNVQAVPVASPRGTAATATAAIVDGGLYIVCAGF